MSNPFERRFALLWDKPLVKMLLVIIVGFEIYYCTSHDLKDILVIALAPLGILFFGYFFMNPETTFILLFCYNYFCMGIARYIGAPWGLGVEGILVFLYISLFFKAFTKDVGFKYLRNELTLVVLIWFTYIAFELLSPENDSNVAWVYGVRQFALYFLLTVPLTLILMRSVKYLDLLLKLWAIFSILAVIKGWGQLYIGLDWAEQKWMNEGGYITHMIWSGLRVFSFFTDAGQFGASMGQSGVVFAIVAVGKQNYKGKLFYILASSISIYGMFLSGTRGAIAVPAAGFMLFLLLVKNWRLFFIGAIIISSAFFILKYTTIGSANQSVSRMRTAFNPQDESLQLRLSNQKKLKAFMADKPFGAGVGSTNASPGAQYYRHKLTSQIPTDSWYVAIWVETGVVGLYLYLILLLYCLVRGGWIIMTRIQNKELYFKLCGLLCGYAGILAASYGNKVLGQFPSTLLIYISLSFVFMAPQLQAKSDIH